MTRIDTYLKQNPPWYTTVVGYIYADSKILLGVRKKVSFGLGKELIAGIGGKVEDGEVDVDALTREFQEEVAITVLSCKEVGHILYLFPHKPKWNQKVTLYIVKNWSGEPNETDVIKPLWYTLTDLPKDRMWPDNLLTIPLIMSGKYINGTFLYDENGQIVEQQLFEE